LAGHPKSSGRT